MSSFSLAHPSLNQQIQHLNSHFKRRRTGRGVYNTYRTCQEEVHGFSGAVYRGFATLKDAEGWVYPELNRQPHTSASGAPTSSASTLPFAPSAPQRQPSSTASHSYQRPSTASQGQSSPTQNFSTSTTSTGTTSSSCRHGVVYCDGAAKGNPLGPIGVGGLLYETGHDDPKERLVATFKHYLAPRGTNNESEYNALIIGLLAALKHKFTHLTVKMDSELVVKQMCGEYKVNAEILKMLHARAVGLTAKFRVCEIEHIPREANVEADRLANEAISDVRGD